jgi:hypothetical protein
MTAGGPLLAVLILAAAVQAADAAPYKRSLYRHWIDEDRDCQNTRMEVLIAESLVPVTLDRKGCKVLKGQWFDPYTGKTFTNPKSLEIDHFIPLKEVHLSGGSRWGAARRKAYANDLSDPDTLIAVSGSANSSKRDKDPARWMPKNKAFHCDYVLIWVAVKTRWNLSMDASEQRAIQTVRAGCPPWRTFRLRPFFRGFRFFPLFNPALRPQS